MTYHVDIKKIENYVRTKCYPAEIKGDKGKKCNFRRACKKFSIINGQLMYMEKRLVIRSPEEKHKIINDIHDTYHMLTTSRDSKYILYGLYMLRIAYLFCILYNDNGYTMINDDDMSFPAGLAC